CGRGLGAVCAGAGPARCMRGRGGSRRRGACAVTRGERESGFAGAGRAACGDAPRSASPEQPSLREDLHWFCEFDEVGGSQSRRFEWPAVERGFEYVEGAAFKFANRLNSFFLGELGSEMSRWFDEFVDRRDLPDHGPPNDTEDVDALKFHQQRACRIREIDADFFEIAVDIAQCGRQAMRDYFARDGAWAVAGEAFRFAPGKRDRDIARVWSGDTPGVRVGFAFHFHFADGFEGARFARRCE